MEGDDFTNFFRINDTLYSNELSILGWEQLKTNDYDYYRVNSEKDYYFGNNPHKIIYIMIMVTNILLISDIYLGMLIIIHCLMRVY